MRRRLSDKPGTHGSKRALPPSVEFCIFNFLIRTNSSPIESALDPYRGNVLAFERTPLTADSSPSCPEAYFFQHHAGSPFAAHHHVHAVIATTNRPERRQPCCLHTLGCGFIKRRGTKVFRRTHAVFRPVIIDAGLGSHLDDRQRLVIQNTHRGFSTDDFSSAGLRNRAAGFCQRREPFLDRARRIANPRSILGAQA